VFRQRRSRGGKSAIQVGAIGLAVAMMSTGCGLFGGDSSGGSSSSGRDCGDSDTSTITVGSANFTESILLGEMYAQVLESNGLDVTRKLNIGNRETYIAAIEDCSIDLLPEYTGSLLLYYDPESTATEPDQVYNDLQAAIPDGLEVLEMSPAADNDVLVVTQETADKYNLHSLTELADISDTLTVGAAPEFRDRKTGLVGLKELYGVDLPFKPLDAGGPLTLKALQNGDIQIGEFFSTQPIIGDENFVILDDPKHLSPAENIVPYIGRDANTDEITSSLNDLSAALTSQDLMDMIRKVDVEKQSVEDVANEYLTSNNMI
jgi:osmoprotectant transport system substrate-binding protein